MVLEMKMDVKSESKLQPQCWKILVRLLII